MKLENERPFALADIEDVRIIIKANGKHYAIVPKGDKEDARFMRIALMNYMFNDYYVVEAPLEEVTSRLQSS